jgi:glycosyltransferase involved in cell wall biosynthesis
MFQNQDREIRAVLTVIVPVYNEVATVEEVLNRVSAELTPKDIVIVDDGSTDGTADVLRRWYTTQSPADHIGRVILLTHRFNRGKGAAIRTGLDSADSICVLVQDADLEVCPEQYPDLVQPILQEQADLVIGYRLTNHRSARRLVFTAGISVLNFAVRVLYGISIRDEACCFKALRTSDLRRMNLECNRFEFCPEVIAKSARLGLRFREVPIVYCPRISAEGKKLRLRDGLLALMTLWKYRRWKAAPNGEIANSRFLDAVISESPSSCPPAHSAVD